MNYAPKLLYVFAYNLNVSAASGKSKKASVYFRHDKLRAHQKQLISDIYAAISEGRILLANAPTGSGKTDSALSAAITLAIQEDLTVFFLTSKISQHKIALEVVKGLADKYKIKVQAVDLIGRSHCCIDDKLRELDSESFMNVCGRKRRHKNCIFYLNARGSDRMGEARAERKFAEVLSKYGAAKTHHELIEIGRAHV